MCVPCFGPVPHPLGRQSKFFLGCSGAGQVDGPNFCPTALVISRHSSSWALLGLLRWVLLIFPTNEAQDQPQIPACLASESLWFPPSLWPLTWDVLRVRPPLPPHLPSALFFSTSVKKYKRLIKVCGNSISLEIIELQLETRIRYTIFISNLSKDFKAVILWICIIGKNANQHRFFKKIVPLNQ